MPKLHTNLTTAPCRRCGRIITTTVHALLAPKAKAHWGMLCERCVTESERRQINHEIGEEITNA